MANAHRMTHRLLELPGWPTTVNDNRRSRVARRATRSRCSTPICRSITYAHGIHPTHSTAIPLQRRRCRYQDAIRRHHRGQRVLASAAPPRPPHPGCARANCHTLGVLASTATPCNCHTLGVLASTATPCNCHTLGVLALTATPWVWSCQLPHPGCGLVNCHTPGVLASTPHPGCAHVNCHTLGVVLSTATPWVWSCQLPHPGCGRVRDFAERARDVSARRRRS